MLNFIGVEFELQPEHNRIRIETCCRLSGKTGVEIEALTAASVAALTIYDMCKAVDKVMEDWWHSDSGEKWWSQWTLQTGGRGLMITVRFFCQLP